MKKLITFTAVFLLIAILGSSAFAEGTYATAGQLYQSWCGVSGNDNYPQGVCGVWSSDGGIDNLTIGVTDDKAGREAREEIVAAVRDDSSLTFVTQKYSYSELQEVKKKVAEYVESYDGPELGAAGWGIYQIDNKVHVEIIESKPGAQAFIDWGHENFGDMIVFIGTQGYDIPASTGISADTDGTIYGDVITAAAAIIIIIAAVVLLRRKLFKGKGEV